MTESGFHRGAMAGRGFDVVLDALLADRDVLACGGWTERQQALLRNRGYRPHHECSWAWVPDSGHVEAVYADLDASDCCEEQLAASARVLLFDLPLGRRNWLRPFRALACLKRRYRLLRHAGSHDAVLHPLLDRGSHLQLLGDEGYWNNKNPFSRGERLRGWLYNRWLGRWLADRVLLVDGVRDPVEMAREAVRCATGSGELVLRGGLLLDTKLITVFRNPEGGDYVCLLPGDALGRHSREMEVEVIRWLQEHPSTRSLVPDCAARVEVEGQVHFVQSLLPGMTVDMPRDDLGNLIELAARWLDGVRMLPSMPGPDAGTALCEDRGVFAARFPRSARRLQWVEDAKARHRVVAHLGTCWFHGDAKLENFLFSNDGRALTGVIDFELSRPEHLAGLDHVYLLAYRWFIENEGRLDCEIERIRAALAFAVAAGLWQRLPGCPGEVSMRRHLLECFVMHHFSCRYHITRPSPGQEARMERLLNALSGLAEGVVNG